MLLDKNICYSFYLSYRSWFLPSFTFPSHLHLFESEAALKWNIHTSKHSKSINPPILSSIYPINQRYIFQWKCATTALRNNHCTLWLNASKPHDVLRINLTTKISRLLCVDKHKSLYLLFETLEISNRRRRQRWIINVCRYTRTYLKKKGIIKSTYELIYIQKLRGGNL